MVKACNCPNCGGKITIPEGRLTFFCQYCGNQLEYDPDIDDISALVSLKEADIKLKEANIELKKVNADIMKQKSKKKNAVGQFFFGLFLMIISGLLIALLVYVGLNTSKEDFLMVGLLLGLIIVSIFFLGLSMIMSLFDSD